MSSRKPPNACQIGARVRIVAEYVEEVACRFADAEIDPIYIDHRADGTTSFWFSKADVLRPALLQALETIPLDYWVGVGIAGDPLWTEEGSA